MRFSVLCLAILLSPPLWADDEAMQLLSLMGTAVKEKNYDGIFTYQSGTKAQSIRIVHRASPQGNIEKLLSLDGAARELVKTDESITCIFPEGKQIQIDKRPLGGGFPSDLLSRLSLAVPYYSIQTGRQDRIAGRAARQLKVMPVDAYRYGYELWVDEESHLLLASQLLTQKGDVLERFTFSSITIGGEISESTLTPSRVGQQVTWERKQTEPVKREDIHQKSVFPELWRVAWLPAGFELVAEQSRRRVDKNLLVEQRVYSDGLSAVSVFIEQRDKTQQHLEGASKMGAVNAFGIVVDNHFITTVGQVPEQTVEKIVRSIEFAKE